MSTTPAAPGSATVVPRRDRIRGQTVEEIKSAARAQLVAHGPAGIQLRAVARDVGLTAPAVYRYFPGIDELIEAVTVDLYGELCDTLEAAHAKAPADPMAQMLAISRAFRTWAVDHPHEFALMFATPPTAIGQQPSSACEEASSRFGSIFAGQFIAIWEAEAFAVPADDALAPGIAEALDPYWTWLTSSLAPAMPKGAVVRFLEGWVRIYGCVAMETFGHLSWAMPDGEPMFEQVMRSLAELVGHPERYAPPA
ncbi:MAG: TetR/AcrR family transcriptional regulator [Actinomycetes bacterium]